MEFVAWFTHKYVMHGFMWGLHRDHHYKDHDSWFERNDFFYIFFATPGIVLIYFGVQSSLMNPLFWFGLGITLYGLAYTFVHDIFIHQRVRVMRQTKNNYLKAMRRAHKVHHKHLGKEHGECFGFLWVPKKYFRDVRGS
jgi:beta-carotene 3-hydroxylase